MKAPETNMKGFGSMTMISVVIPTFNNSMALSCTLEGFALQSINNYELLIIDDGGTDDTEAVVNNYKGKSNIVYHRTENKGRSSARNRGIEIAQGDIIVFCDSDRIPANLFLEGHMNSLIQNSKAVSIGRKLSILRQYKKKYKIPFHAQHGILKLIERNPFVLQQMLAEDELFSPKSLMNDFDKIMQDFYLYEAPDNFNDIREIYSNFFTDFSFSWVAATTGNLAYHRKGHEQIRFDERFEGWGAEDTDFAYQLYLEDCCFQFSEQALNYHQEHPRAWGEKDQLKQNIKFMCQKYSDSIEVLLWSKALEYKPDFTFIEANLAVKEYKLMPESVLKKTYLDALKETICNL